MTEDDKKVDILENTRKHGAIRIQGKQAAAFWGAAIDALVDEGKVKCRFVEDYDDQCSWYEITLTRKESR